MELKQGELYTRQQIAEILGGGSVQENMPNKDGRVLCLCLNPDFDPARPVALVGRGPKVEEQAAMFCRQENAVPVFFKKRANLWEYAGDYKCVRWTQDIDELAGFEETSGRLMLTRVIFLEKA